jgi:hypothetical protein
MFKLAKVALSRELPLGSRYWFANIDEKRYE